MGEAAKAQAKIVGTLSIRVKRAGSDEWEDHGTVPAYIDPAEPETPTKPEASAQREEK